MWLLRAPIILPPLWLLTSLDSELLWSASSSCTLWEPGRWGGIRTVCLCAEMSLAGRRSRHGMLWDAKGQLESEGPSGSALWFPPPSTRTFPASTSPRSHSLQFVELSTLQLCEEVCVGEIVPYLQAWNLLTFIALFPTVFSNVIISTSPW